MKVENASYRGISLEKRERLGVLDGPSFVYSCSLRAEPFFTLLKMLQWIDLKLGQEGSLLKERFKKGYAGENRG